MRLKQHYNKHLFDEEFFPEESVDYDEVYSNIEESEPACDEKKRAHNARKSIEEYMERKRLHEDTHDPFDDENDTFWEQDL